MTQRLCIFITLWSVFGRYFCFSPGRHLRHRQEVIGRGSIVLAKRLTACNLVQAILVYWVGGNAPAVLALREYVLKHSHRPYQPVYVELFATLAPKLRGGDASGYDGLLSVDSIENISLHMPDMCRSLPQEG